MRPREFKRCHWKNGENKAKRLKSATGKLVKIGQIRLRGLKECHWKIGGNRIGKAKTVKGVPLEN